MTYTLRHCAVILTALAAMQTPLFAQVIDVIDEEALCAACRITLERAVSLGAETGDGFVSPPAGLQFWGNHWLVAHWAKRGMISVYDPSGEFVGDIGRSGEGPGEFRFAGRMVAQGDTLFVLDHELARITVFDSRFDVRRTVRVPTGNVISFERVPGAGFVISAEMYGQHTVGRPLHILSPDGTLRSSFGVERPEIRPDMPHRNQRLVAVAANGTIWSVRRTDYVLEQWDASGNKLRELRRNAPWFQSHGRGGFVARDAAPNPTINAFWIDAAGRAWIGIEVPDNEWRNAVSYRGLVQGVPRWGVTDEDEYLDTVVELVDLASASVLAQGRMESALSSARLPGFLVSYRESPAGTQLIDVWRPRLNITPREVP